MKRTRERKPRRPKTMEEIAAAFHALRGDQRDEDWAWSVAAQLDLDDVRPDLTREALADLLPELRETKRSAYRSFGDPVKWAREREAKWHSEGVLVTTRPEPFLLSDFAGKGLWMAAVITVILMIMQLTTHGWSFDITWTLVLAPPLLAAAILLVLRMWNTVLQRNFRRFVIEMIAVAVVIYGGGTVLVLGQRALLAQAPGLLMLAVAAAYGLAATYVARSRVTGDPGEK